MPKRKKDKTTFFQSLVSTPGWKMYIEELQELLKQTEHDILVCSEKDEAERQFVQQMRGRRKALLDAINLPENIIKKEEDPMATYEEQVSKLDPY